MISLSHKALLPSGAEWGSYIWGRCSACSVHISDPVICFWEFPWGRQPCCVLNHTFNAGTNWLCYCSWMWALLCISPYIRRCWDLGACVTKTCLAVSAAGIEQTSECIKRFVSYYRVRQPVHKNSPGDCKHLLPDFSWGMWTTLLEYLQFEFSVLQP